jgi:hypothetical protein
MDRRKVSVAGAAVLLVAMLGIGAASAWTAGPRIMYVTFSGPVLLPGVTLPAGTYIFERADPLNHIDLVRVLARDRSKVYLLGFTTQVPRPEGLPRDRVILFHEARTGAAPRIDAWFPQDEPVGHRFVY